MLKHGGQYHYIQGVEWYELYIGHGMVLIIYRAWNGINYIQHMEWYELYIGHGNGMNYMYGMEWYELHIGHGMV